MFVHHKWPQTSLAPSILGHQTSVRLLEQECVDLSLGMLYTYYYLSSSHTDLQGGVQCALSIGVGKKPAFFGCFCDKRLRFAP